MVFLGDAALTGEALITQPVIIARHNITANTFFISKLPFTLKMCIFITIILHERLFHNIKTSFVILFVLLHKIRPKPLFIINKGGVNSQLTLLDTVEADVALLEAAECADNYYEKYGEE